MDTSDWHANRPTHNHLTTWAKPEEREARKEKVGLCLSGGGFRAALFHLGSLRRLNEIGMLQKIDYLSAVSGGSILVGFLLEKFDYEWPTNSLSLGDWIKRIEDPFRSLTRKDLRTIPFLSQIWGRRPVETLVDRYAKFITPRLLSDLPEEPKIFFGATELVYRRYWTASKRCVGDPAVGWPPLQQSQDDSSVPYWEDESYWSVARATAASSCFPPIFGPMKVHVPVPSGTATVMLSDGGVYDNTGYLALWDKCETILVSDGGGVTSIASKLANPVRLLMRYQAVQEYAGGHAQKALILTNLLNELHSGTYWSINTSTKKYSPTAPGYDRLTQNAAGIPIIERELIDSYIGPICTDIAVFKPKEQEVLINHGYLLAAASMDRYVPDPARSLPLPVTIPFKDMMEPAAVRKALANSKKRKLFPRL
jgi:NTE family protein